MAIALASTDNAQPHAKIPQVTGVKKNGKNWHENKKPFRPGTRLTSYAKRTEKQKQEAEVKKMEKEMKAEKEEERQVRSICAALFRNDLLTISTEENPGHQGQACRKGGEGTLRADGCQDAPEAR